MYTYFYLFIDNCFANAYVKLNKRFSASYLIEESVSKGRDLCKGVKPRVQDAVEAAQEGKHARHHAREHAADYATRAYLYDNTL